MAVLWGLIVLDFGLRFGIRHLGLGVWDSGFGIWDSGTRLGIWDWEVFTERPSPTCESRLATALHTVHCSGLFTQDYRNHVRSRVTVNIGSPDRLIA